ncbi:hypothetical protein [carnivorous sponge associated iridovirus]|jgi:hypothetical protein|nr:hypothetical protein [carnivorous sponge associated iridovirus]
MVIQNVAKFAFGFVIGMVVEWVGIYVYKQIDPEEESNVKLVALVLMQLIVLFTMMEKFSLVDDFYTRVGMFSSQVFVFDYALKRLYPFRNYLKRPSKHFS